MSLNTIKNLKLIFTLTLGITLWLQTTLSCFADGSLTNRPTTNATDKLASATNSIRVYNPPGHCQISTETGTFYFGVPEGFTAQLNPANQQIFVGQPNAPFYITVKIFETWQPQPASFHKQQLLNEHPGAEIIRESEALAGVATAPLYELRWTNGSVSMGAQAVVASVPRADVTFQLVGVVKNGETDESARVFLQRLLLTLKRAEPTVRSLIPPPTIAE